MFRNLFPAVDPQLAHPLKEWLGQIAPERADGLAAEGDVLPRLAAERPRRKESPVQVVLPERTAPSQMMASYRWRRAGLRHQPSTCFCLSDQRTGLFRRLLIACAIPVRKPQLLHQVVPAGAPASSSSRSMASRRL